MEPANVGELVATARDTGLLTMPELKLLQALEEPVTRAQPEDRANAVRGVVAGQVAEYSALFVKLIAVYQKPPLQVLALSLAQGGLGLAYANSEARAAAAAAVRRTIGSVSRGSRGGGTFLLPVSSTGGLFAAVAD